MSTKIGDLPGKPIYVEAKVKAFLSSIILGAVLLTTGVTTAGVTAGAAMAFPGEPGMENGMVEPLGLTSRQQEGYQQILMQRIRKKLDLSDQQSEKMSDIMSQARVDRQIVLKKYGLNEQQMKALGTELKQLRAESRNNMKELLTDEQLNQFQRTAEKKYSERNRRTEHN